ncbi:MAG: histidine kinase [Deltaproteobacteria bacterium CG_4_9_14_3_um_filter_63_12]|nr:MAG: histidine kinase [Deltaproteobacteria bacterium CG17_big_fil_post_rev_8_21_14_2_50_63_7]PJB38807.1 MAG: histidine kinase [Deltaproteobacteria bacterium CG_4_9_14_3_um_filter_63_12]
MHPLRLRPPPASMDIQTQSSLLSAIVCLAIAISIQIRGRRSRLHLYFVLLNTVLAVWNLGFFLQQVSDPAMGFRIAMLAALAIPWCAMKFFATFLGTATKLTGVVTNTTAVVSLLLMPVIISPLFDNRWVNLLVLVYVFAVLYLCMFLIYKRLGATESRVESARLWYLVIGGLVAITFSLTDYLPKIDVFFPTVGTVFTVIFMFFLSQILVQYRLLDLTEFFGKIAVLGSLVSLLAAIYGLLIYFVGDQPGTLFFTSLVASFVVLILFEPLRIFVEAKIARYNLRERFDFGRQMAKLRREMANVLELGQMVTLIFGRFENMRRITHAALYLLEGDAQNYKCIGHVGPQPKSMLDAVSSRDFVDRLRDGETLVREAIEDDIHELRELGSSQENENAAEGLGQLAKLEGLMDLLDEIKAGVVFPILSDRRLIGFLTLWDARVREAYLQDELNAVQQVANQIAIVVENSKLVEKLQERDRLAALGEMAAGLAHEIRNPLGAIKGAAQLLQMDDAADNESAEFLQVIIEEVNRLNNVVSQFLDYARSERTSSENLDINPCIERTVQLVRNKAEEGMVEVKTRFATHLPQVRGDTERLTQVFLNLALNAIDAMAHSENKVLTLSSALGRRKEPGLGGTLVRDVVEIRFEDTGRGMTVEELRNIFIPFYTTKQTGTGLGLPICQRLVRSFGGALSVTSQPGVGTVFTVQLPIVGEEAITGSTLKRERRSDSKTSEANLAIARNTDSEGPGRETEET